MKLLREFVRRNDPRAADSRPPGAWPGPSPSSVCSTEEAARYLEGSGDLPDTGRSCRCRGPPSRGSAPERATRHQLVLEARVEIAEGADRDWLLINAQAKITPAARPRPPRFADGLDPEQLPCSTITMAPALGDLMALDRCPRRPSQHVRCRAATWESDRIALSRETARISSRGGGDADAAERCSARCSTTS